MFVSVRTARPTSTLARVDSANWNGARPSFQIVSRVFWPPIYELKCPWRFPFHLSRALPESNNESRSEVTWYGQNRLQRGPSWRVSRSSRHFVRAPTRSRRWTWWCTAGAHWEDLQIKNDDSGSNCITCGISLHGTCGRRFRSSCVGGQKRPNQFLASSGNMPPLSSILCSAPSLVFSWHFSRPWGIVCFLGRCLYLVVVSKD